MEIPLFVIPCVGVMLLVGTTLWALGSRRESLARLTLEHLRGIPVTLLLLLSEAAVAAGATFLLTGFAQIAMLSAIAVFVPRFLQSWKKTPGQTASVVYCFGHLLECYVVKESGDFWLPFFLSLVPYTTREISLNVPELTITTNRTWRDGDGTLRTEAGALALANASIEFRITDLVKFAKLIDPRTAIIEEMVNALRVMGQKFTIEEIPLRNGEIAAAIKDELNRIENGGESSAQRWGVRIIEIQVTGLQQPTAIQEANARIAIERSLAAAEGEKQGPRIRYIKALTELGIPPDTAFNGVLAEADKATRVNIAFEGLGGSKDSQLLGIVTAAFLAFEKDGDMNKLAGTLKSEFAKKRKGGKR